MHLKNIIFVLDDDISIRLLMRHIIESFGYKVEVFDDAKKAIEALHEGVFLIFTDLNMQPMSGLHFSKIVRQHSSIPIVMITAQGEQSSEIYARALGVNGFLTKPFSREQLFTEIEKYDQA